MRLRPSLSHSGSIRYSATLGDRFINSLVFGTSESYSDALRPIIWRFFLRSTTSSIIIYASTTDAILKNPPDSPLASCSCSYKNQVQSQRQR
jgi:hypothetical protein